MVASSQVIVIKMVDAEVILVGNYLSFFSGFTLLFLGFVTVILYFFFFFCFSSMQLAFVHLDG